MTKTQQWLSFRRNYLKRHLSNHEGYYVCAICNRWVSASDVQLDHILNRSTHPHLVFEESNIQLVHPRCNTNKKLGF
jgi:5-methylcytosine-specific restriction endonuclease McrA